MQNGVRSSNEQKYLLSSSSTISSAAAALNSGPTLMGAPLTNGRALSSSTAASANSNPSSLFSKPTKLPPNDQLEPLQSLMPMPQLPSLTQPPATPTSAVGGDIESILKIMTSSLAPLSKIAATPRTEVEVQQPNKQHVYAELPPSLFKPPMKPRKFYLLNSLSLSRSLNCLFAFIYVHLLL